MNALPMIYVCDNANGACDTLVDAEDGDPDFTLNDSIVDATSELLTRVSDLRFQLNCCLGGLHSEISLASKDTSGIKFDANTLHKYHSILDRIRKIADLFRKISEVS